MKVHVALVSLAVFYALTGLQASASTPISPYFSTGASTSARKISDPATEIFRPTPHVLSVISSATALHRFPVMDEKGLLLTCVAPELDKDRETDVFKDCTLAPGRTLDDVMHSFVQGIHEEQRLRMREHADSQKYAGENADAKGAQK